MRTVDVLVLHGSPGSGKSTLARAIAEVLRVGGVANAVIDLDELSLVFPSPARSFASDNLRAVWPNYAAIPGLKVIIASVIADVGELAVLRESVPGASLTVCELTAPEAVLKQRVTARESNDYWQGRLRGFVDLYLGRGDLAGIRDFRVSTHDQSEQAAAHEVVQKMGWLA